MKREQIKKILGVLGNIAFFIVIAIAIFAVVLSITAKRDENGATVFGKKILFVKSESMAKNENTDVSGYKIKSIPAKSCIVVEVVPESGSEEWYDKLAVGDVITFRYVYTKQETITHRIVEKRAKESGGYIITLEGDNKSENGTVMRQTIDTSEENSPNYIIGKVVGKSYILGLIVYALRSAVGIIFIIIVPCAIVIAYEVIRIVRVIGKEKDEKREKEIEELKRQLEEIKTKNERE